MVLSMELMRIAESYGAQEKMSDIILEECSSLIKSYFAMLGVGELREAFQMAAAGELPNQDFKIYYGKFNAEILSSVLRAYRSYRQKVVAQLVEYQSRQSQAELDNRQHEQKRLAFDATFPDLVKDAKAKKKYSSWHSVPVFWYHVAQRLGILKMDRAEKEVIWKEAQPLAIQSLKLETLQLQQRHHQHCQQLLKNLEEGIIDQSHVQLVARKLAVWKKLLKHESSEEKDT